MPSSTKHEILVSADSNERLRRAQQWIESYSPDTGLLLLAHSSEAANDLHLRIVHSRGTAFGVKRFSLNSLATRLAQPRLLTAELVPATRLSLTAVVARAVHTLHSQSRLTYFAPVASKPGFPTAVVRTLEELRMNEVEPASLLRLIRGGEDIAAIAELVDEELNRASLSERAVLFRAAIEAIESHEDLANVGLPLVLLDIVVTSALEMRLLKALAERAPAVLATVQRGDERSLQALEDALGVTRTHNETSLDSSTCLAHVKRHLFEDSAPPPTQLDESVRLSNWPGEPRECVEIVRSIEAEAERGVALDQMAVLLNSPGEYRSHLEEAFARADIAAHFVQGITAPDPAGRAMLALLACAADGLSAKRFAEYLSLGEIPLPEDIEDVDSRWVAPDDELVSYLTDFEEIDTKATAPPSTVPRPEDLDVIDGALRTPARWERLIVDSSVIGGRDRWYRRLTGLANEFQIRLDEVAPEEEALVESIKRQLRDLNALRNYTLPLIDRLSNLPHKASWGKWLAHLRDLSINALRNPDGVLATLADLEPMTSVGPVDLNDVQIVLETKLRDLRTRPRRRHYGSVFIGSVDAARGMSFQIVFVPGLAEKVFPRKIVEDPILPDVQRAELSEHLTTRRHQLDAERTALRLAVGCARERVYLSYARVDVQQSRPRVPSFYVLEALRAAQGELPGFEEVAEMAESKTRARLGWPAPESPEAAIDNAEYDLALLANLVEADKKDTTGAAHYLLTSNKHLARALRARSRRWLKRWTPNDGLVDPDPLALESIAKHQFSSRSFSATALQLYSSCPYRFFLSAVLRLALRNEPAAIEVIDPLTRGSLFHDTQFEILTKLKAEGLLPLTTGGPLGLALSLVDVALERLARDYEDKLAPAIPRVWEDGINGIRLDLHEWLRRMAENNDGWIPDKFELSFGLSDRGPRSSDPASVDDPVEIIGDLKLRGSIDMVERHGDGRFRVTDHKTGKARAERDTVVGGGKHLQPLLYALACQKLLNGRVDSGRLYYCTADGGYEERNVRLNEESTQILNSVLSTIRQGLVDGFLPAAPDKDACTWCDFLAVCGDFEEQRVEKKPRDRLIQIKALRNLP